MLDRESTTGWLSPETLRELLDAAGIPLVDSRLVRSEAEALRAAQAFGFPVVMKASGPAIVHKTESNAVMVNLTDEEMVRATFWNLMGHRDVTAVHVEPMVTGGVEMMVGGTLDPTFGPVVVCGSGGTLVELMKDTVLRLAPLSDMTATEMLDDVRGVARLRGFRGAAPLDEAALRRFS